MNREDRAKSRFFVALPAGLMLVGLAAGPIAASPLFPQLVCPAGGGPHAIVVTGDFNRDGRLDMAVANPLSSDVSMFLATTDGTFAPQVRYAAGAGPVALAVGDFNGDFKPDLAVANQGSND